MTDLTVQSASNSAWSTYLLLHRQVDEDDDRRIVLCQYITHLYEDGEHNRDALRIAGLVYLRKLDELDEERERRLAGYRALDARANDPGRRGV